MNWHVVEHSWSDTSVCDEDGRVCLLTICDIAIEDNQQELEQAMAKKAALIAAAPELLEALRAVVSVADRKTVEFDMARAAITKATGESA